MRLGHRETIFTSLAILAIGLTGCGKAERGAVSGQVTLDGQPVDGGEIRFLPDVGFPARARIVAGHYEIPSSTGPSVGPVRVEVFWVHETGRTLPAKPPAAPGTMVNETAQCVPERYNTRSELKADITPGANTYDLTLTTHAQQ